MASNGTVTSTEAPSGESVFLVPGVTAIAGLKGTWSQPVGLIPAGSGDSKRDEPSGNFGFGASTESARR